MLDDKKYSRIRELIKDIYALAGNRKDWYKDPKIATRVCWMKNLEATDE